MDITLQTPRRALLRLGHDTGTSQRNSSDSIGSCRREESYQLREARRWMLLEAFEQANLMEMLRLFLRQPIPTSPLLPFTRVQRSCDLRQDSQHSHQRPTLETNSRLLVQDPASQVTTNANTLHRRTSRAVRGPQPPYISGEARHKQRKQELLARLDSIVQEHDSDCSHLFLCLGKKSQCKIVAVKIPNSAEDVAIWQLIRQAWYADRGKWRKHIPVLDVQQIEIVKVSIAGPQRTKNQGSASDGHFVGTCSSIDFADEKRQHEKTIAGYDPQEYPCAYDPSTGSTNCSFDCVSYQVDFAECPERMLHHAQRQLLRHRMLPFLRLAFSDPRLAEGNDLFEDQNLIKSHKDVLRKLDEWHCPRLGELDFEALWLDDAPVLCHATLLLIAALLTLAVFVAKLIFVEWSTAWTVGCFIVALMTLYWMCDSDATRS